ncbi:energy-coupling factor transporter transmembrane component T [Vallitaleaceae bacterium 9-2]
MEKSYMQVTLDQEQQKLDPRTKIMILLIINMSAFTVNAWYVMALAAAIPLSLLWLTKQYRQTMLLTMVYASSLVLYILLLDTAHGSVSIVIAMLTSVINRMGPGLLMGYYLLRTTTVSEFIAAMERLKIPKQVTIPLSVMFRFFPTIKQEHTSINDAMKMRGVSFGSSKGNILTLMEYRLIPLFISCVKIGEELSCSALTRGLGAETKRTNVCHIGFAWRDYLYTLFALVTLVLLIYSKGR